MTVPNENYVKDFVTRNCAFIIQLIILLSFFVHKNVSIISMCAPFLAKCLMSITSSIFPKVWPFSKRYWENLEMVLLLLLFLKNVNDPYIMIHCTVYVNLTLSVVVFY